jgi:hypothetical protein
MYSHRDVKTAQDSPIPETMKAWVLGFSEKPTPVVVKAKAVEGARIAAE